VEENEPQAMAEKIAFVLSVLHWPFTKLPAADRHSELIREGISIGPGIKRTPDLTFQTFVSQRERAFAMSDAIRGALSDSGIESNSGSGADSQFVQSGELLISVGRKPNHALEDAIRELGPTPQATPLGGNFLGDNRVEIPDPKP
jgi:hypothetical protein